MYRVFAPDIDQEVDLSRTKAIYGLICPNMPILIFSDICPVAPDEKDVCQGVFFLTWSQNHWQDVFTVPNMYWHRWICILFGFLTWWTDRVFGCPFRCGTGTSEICNPWKTFEFVQLLVGVVLGRKFPNRKLWRECVWPTNIYGQLTGMLWLTSFKYSLILQDIDNEICQTPVTWRCDTHRLET